MVVTVSCHVDAGCPPLPLGVQKKLWRVPNPARSDSDLLSAFRACRDDLKARVGGLVGGLKLLARLDADDRGDIA